MSSAHADVLQSTIDAIATPGKGILAADESTSTITKRFASINLESTEENRRAYRTLLCTTPELEKYISGVILFEETLFQKANDGTPLPQILANKGIIPGIKVDKGLIPFASNPHEKVTQGLDGLPERLQDYQQAGARFAKWRVVFDITTNTPSRLAIHTNAELLGRYAAICQAQGIVPIVEPELLMDGDHDLARAERETEKILHHVFLALYRHHVTLEHIILKPNMVVDGKKASNRANAQAVAAATLKVLRRTVPAAVPTINFLSGGQTPSEATANLNAINAQSQPWHLSYSYGRALQEPCLMAWKGNAENINTAQSELLKRARLNSAAVMGQYQAHME
ncbi:MAG: fructose-bisphosphate aldolase class I [Gammaproteobacteria bacterium]